jgi:hypothetical protein
MNRAVPFWAIVLIAMWMPHGFSFQNAYAGSEHSSNGCEHSNSHGSASCDDHDSSEGEHHGHHEESDSHSYSTQTPVCDCSGSVAASEETAAQAQEDYDRAKEDDDRAKEDDDKTILCHVPPGNSGNPQTLYLPASAVSAHLSQHADDYLGSCVGDESEETRGYEREKSKCSRDKDDADHALEEASKAKDEADQNKSDMDAALAAGGDPCTCPDGTTSRWLYGNPGSSAAPTYMRQIHGQ